LGEILGIVGRTSEAVTNVVDASIVGLHDFLPGGSVPGNTASDQHCDDLDVFHLHSPENPDLVNVETKRQAHENSVIPTEALASD
jgi:hypothetical protein